jgi:hypothetical protein
MKPDIEPMLMIDPLPAAPEHAIIVHVVDIEPQFVAHVLRSGSAARDPGVVDQNVDASPLGRNFIGKRRNRIRLRHVDDRDVRLQPRPLHLRLAGGGDLGTHVRNDNLGAASASALMQARPIARPPPVTTATLPSSFNFSRYMALCFPGLPSDPPSAAIDDHRTYDQ